MGVLTDFVVAAPSDAQRVGDSHCPSREFNGIEAKGIGSVELSTLHAILTRTPVDSGFMGGDCLLYSPSDEGPWVLLVPTDLVQRLAELSAHYVVATAEEWAKTEEFSPKYSRWTLDVIKGWLQELARLCRQAVAEKKAVLMWMSL